MAKQVKVDILTETRGSIGNLAKLTAGIGAAVAAYAALSKVAKELIEAYRAQEQAEASFVNALRNTGELTDKNRIAMKELASELQRVTLFGDEATISAAGLLTQLSGLEQDGVRKLLPGLQDMAQSLGMSLEQAASLAGKSISSTTNALARYGIQIDTTASESEKAAQIMEQLETRFGGAARAAGDTATGALTQLKNAFGDVKEAGGEMIAGAIEPAVRALTGFITRTLQAWDAQRKLNRAMKGYADTLADNQLAREHIADEYMKLIARRRQAEISLEAAQKSGHATAIAGARSELQNVEQLIKTNRARLDAVLENADAIINQNKAIEANNVLIKSLATDSGPALVETLEDQTDALVVLSEMYWTLTGMEEKFFTGVVVGAGEAVEKIDHMAEIVRGLTEDMQDLINTVAQEAFLGSFERIGEALATGADATEALTRGLLDYVGTFMSKLAPLLLEAGLRAIATSTTEAQFWIGVALVAASGLVALGAGLFKGAAGSRTGAGGTSGGGGTGGTGTTGTTQPTVVIHFHGSVTKEDDFDGRIVRAVYKAYRGY